MRAGTVYEEVDAAVAAALRAADEFRASSLDRRRRIIEAIRAYVLSRAEELAFQSVQETGLGRVADKVGKNILVATKTPGVEILAGRTFAGGAGQSQFQRAPFGVIAAITPCTNPTETIVNNAIGMIAGGNGVVFHPHPAARRVGRALVQSLGALIVDHGGPADLLTVLAEPSIASATELMRHPDIDLVVVTGGPAVVKAAFASGKRVIAAGPGNPPAVVDETADLAAAARAIVDGASFDNNVVCIAEKEVVVVEQVADELLRAMKETGAVYLATEKEAAALARRLVVDDAPAKDRIGKDASVLLADIGVDVGPEIRLIVVEVDEEHPFARLEMLMPVLGVIAVPDWQEAVAAAKRLERGRRHTATMHSQRLDRIRHMERTLGCTLFARNAPSFSALGFGSDSYTSFTIASPTGEGLTTALSFTREVICHEAS